MAGKPTGHGDFERTSSWHPAPGNAGGSAQFEQHKKEQVRSDKQQRKPGRRDQPAPAAPINPRKAAGVKRQRDGVARQRDADAPAHEG